MQASKKLSVIIPYRNRIKALNLLIPKLKEYIPKQTKNFELVVVEQDDNKLFNKGVINNLGFLLLPDSDYYCFHDVDYIPEIADYSYPDNPVHVSTYNSQFGYAEHKDSFMGGVIIFRKEHFEGVNGYPINCVGWGSEDNMLAERVKRVGLNAQKFPGRFYCVPHTPRINDPIEYAAHIKNGAIRENEKAGRTSMWENGLKNLNIKTFEISIEDKKDYKHIKVRKKRIKLL
jgi:hypothetical protein